MSGGRDHGSWNGRRAFRHWYRNNQVYFITARCRDRFPALAGEEAKAIFWAAFEKHTRANGFVPWVTSVMDNHWHTVGYLREGVGLPRMMQGIHGSVAKLVNDLLEERVRQGSLSSPALDERGRLVPFWRESKRKNYMDGCLRDLRQGALTWRYVWRQSVRHGLVRAVEAYGHTRVNVEMERALKRAAELGAFLEGVPYAPGRWREKGWFRRGRGATGVKSGGA